jgi:diguanylate cyclase (GGDEF)-like protein
MVSGAASATSSGPGNSPVAPARRPLRRAPLALQALIAGALLLALVLPFALRHLGLGATKNSLPATLLALLVISVANVEIGRLLEGGISTSDRAHKALSAWGFCAALLLPTPYILPVVALSYAHARWRGVRLPLWKWVGSASYVVLAGLAAAVVARAVHGPDPNLMDDNGGWGLLSSCCAAAVFLAVETLLFHGSAYLNDADDEVWLRRTLASPSFYVTEASVLLMGALSAAVWTAGAWFMLLLVPVYILAQQAALNEPLRLRAETDEKTGLLRFESWRALAVTEQRRCELKSRAWSVAFADLDHFKRYNDEFGHLAGDAALATVADVLREQLRSRDLVGRFGGEEFCVFLPDTVAAEALMVGERLVAAVAGRELPGGCGHTTISVGVVTFAPDADVPQFFDALTAADRALFEAKTQGRNRVVQHEVRAGGRRRLDAPRPVIVRE